MPFSNNDFSVSFKRIMLTSILLKCLLQLLISDCFSILPNFENNLKSINPKQQHI